MFDCSYPQAVPHSSLPKHIPIPPIPRDGDILFELVMFVFSAICCALQFLIIYRSVFWLPYSFTNFALVSTITWKNIPNFEVSYCCFFSLLPFVPECSDDWLPFACFYWCHSNATSYLYHDCSSWTSVLVFRALASCPKSSPNHYAAMGWSCDPNMSLQHYAHSSHSKTILFMLPVSNHLSEIVFVLLICFMYLWLIYC